MTAVNRSSGPVGEALRDPDKFPLLKLMFDSFGDFRDSSTGYAVFDACRWIANEPTQPVRIKDGEGPGHPAWSSLAKPGDRFAVPSFWAGGRSFFVEGEMPLIDAPASGADIPGCGQQKPIYAGVLFRPIRRFSPFELVSAKAFVLWEADEFFERPFPLAIPGEALTDLGAYRRETNLGFADFLRVRNGVRATTGATLPELLAMDAHFVNLNGAFNVRCSPETPNAYSLRPDGYEALSVVEDGDAGLRALLAGVAVDWADYIDYKFINPELKPHLSPDAWATAEKYGKRCATYFTIRGPHLTTAALATAADLLAFN